MNKLETDLVNYIKNKKCYCCYCSDLKKEVLKRGLIAIDEYEGMICGSVEDMLIRYSETKSNQALHSTGSLGVWWQAL